MGFFKRVVEIDPRLDLKTLFYPSFVLPLIEVQDYTAVKLWGICRGLKIFKEGSRLVIEHSDKVCLDYADEVLGFWSIPRTFSVIDKGYREFAEALASMYSWLGIATSSRDDIEVFTSIFLSQNTDFHKNVVKWMRRILEKFGSVEATLDLGIDRISRDIGKSYQVLSLSQALRTYLTFRYSILQSSVEEAKKYLLKTRGIGPKTFYAYAVFVKKSTAYAPIDKNLVHFLNRFYTTSGIVSGLPRKDRCISYVCELCPTRYSCTHYRFRRVFGELSAWVQTVAYVHNKLMCRPGLCRGCSLKLLCKTTS